MFRDVHKIIIMGCGGDSCSAVFLKKVKDRHIDDLKGRPIEEVRKIRDIIEGKVDELKFSVIKG